MRATCSTNRDDLKGLKKSANYKHPNRSFAKVETFNDNNSLQRQNSISSTLVTKPNEVASLPCPQHHSNAHQRQQVDSQELLVTHYDTLPNTNLDKNADKCCYG